MAGQLVRQGLDARLCEERHHQERLSAVAGGDMGFPPSLAEDYALRQKPLALRRCSIAAGADHRPWRQAVLRTALPVDGRSLRRHGTFPASTRPCTRGDEGGTLFSCWSCDSGFMAGGLVRVLAAT